MKRRLTSLLLVLTMIFTLLPIQAFAADAAKPADTSNPFEDVKRGSWYYDAVQYTRVNGIFAGTGKTTFRPEGAMTRGMFVTVLGRMAGVNPDNYAGPSAFTDVPENAWYAPYVAWAAKYGVTVGTGEGKFSPDAYIDRQQMAVLFVRYFEAFNVDYETGTNITTTPADLDSVSPWARDAVLKLWRTGLLVGDGESFNPMGSATRAQAATICSRTDETVTTWYSEPGIPSTRVRIDPATGLPYDSGSQPGKPSGGSSGGSSGGGTTTTTYYMVTFALGTNQTGMTLPQSGTYPANTQIGALPTPTAAGADKVFLGWYYDAAMSSPAKESDVLTRDVTLYAKVGAGAKVTEADTPKYIAAQDLPASFQLKLGGSYQEGDLTITNVTANNANVTFTVNNGAVTITGIAGVDGEETTRPEFSGKWNPGDTYKAVLKDGSSALFIDQSDAEQALTIRTYNFTIERETVTNLELDGGLKYIPKSAASNMTGGLEGLFQVSLVQGEDGQTKPVQKVNQETGTFTYTGAGNGVTLDKGDTVAIYETKGNRALDSSMTLTDSDHVAYVEITAVNGTTYSYKTADTEDVLFTPDILPVNSNKKAAGGGGTLTLTGSDMAELRTNLAEIGLDANITLDKGDFIAFYEGNLTGQTRTAGNQPEYGEITGVTAGENGAYTVTYKNVSESSVLSAMDVYTKENKKIELTQEQIEKIEDGIAKQAVASGFLDNAARELTALALETDGFQKLAEDFDLESYAITFADGTPAGPEDLALMAGAEATITSKTIKPKVHIGNLDHFDKSSGIRIELVMDLTIEVTGTKGNKLAIKLQAIFEQEVMLSVNASGGAIWKWAFIIPYIYDYRLNANIDVGTYTGIGITATAKTESEGDDEFDWNMTTGNSAGDKIIDIGKQIKELMEEKDKFMGKDLVGGDDGDDDGGGIPISGGLAEKYAAMIEDAGEDTSWIEIFKYEIFAEEGSVDPFHILCYGISADFVVKANFYVTLGMTFEYGAAKRYNFSIMLFHKESTNETIDLETPHYRFTFYVMGTMGVKAGVEFEIGVGLFSLKLDSIGICAEAGAYAQMWGYFYYEATWEQGSGKNSQYSGAMLIEIGVYLEISFKAQLFGSDKLTYQPTIYEHQWPILTVGEQENVFDFAEYDDSGNEIALEYDVQSATTLALPSALFSMQYLDLQSGETGGDKDDEGKMQPGRDCDDDTESRFEITMSDSRYAYNPATNTVTISPNGAVQLPDCTMTIRWKNGTLAFTSRPIERVVTISWKDPANARYIAFDSQGGTLARSIYAAYGAPVTDAEWPAPTKTGYHFVDWYTAASGGMAYPKPDTMPNFEPDRGVKGITLYAHWEPRDDTKYTVEHYQEELNGTYKKYETDNKQGRTDDPINAGGLKKTYTGFTYDHAGEMSYTIAPDGSTVVKLYYTRNKYEVKFTYGSPAGMSAGSVPAAKTYTAKYQAKVYAPMLALKGYTFHSFSPAVSSEDKSVTVAGDATYAAQWTAGTDTPYRVEHYARRVSGEGYLLDSVESKTGTTNTAANAEQKTLPGFTYSRTEPASAAIAPDGSTVVRLYYDRNSYTLTLDAAAGTLTGGTTKTLLYGAAIAADNPTRTGYTFAGWFYTGDGGEIQLQAGDTMPAGNLTLTAKWTARGDIPYKVEHYWQDADTGNYALHETENLTGATGAAVTATAKTYAHYHQNASAPGTVSGGTIAADGGLTLKLYYDLETVTVTFDPNGGTIAGGETTKPFRYGQSFSGPTPTRTGYGFGGWFSGGTKYTSTTKVTAAVTLTAQWAEGQVDYRVEHYLMGLDGQYPASATYTDNETGTTGAAINIGEKQKTYEGFAYDHAGAASYTVASDGSTVVKLYYSRNQYTLTWNLNGGTASNSYTQGQVYYGAAITPPTPVKTGYTCQWDQTPPGTMPAQGVTCTANWTANTYTVKFDLNGGTGTAPANVSATYDQTFQIPSATPTRDGYTFGGWAASQTAATAEYQAGASVSNLTAENNAAVTLYAVWQPSSYTITYNLNGGTNAADAPAAYTIKDAVTLANPTREGYTFQGWYDNEGLTGTAVTKIETGSTGDKTFWAKWEVAKVQIDYQILSGLPAPDGGISALLTDGTTLASELKPSDSLPTPSLKSGKFFRWCSDPNTPTAAVTSVPSDQTGTYTVYLVYAPNTINTAEDLKALQYANSVENTRDVTFTLNADIELDGNWTGCPVFSGTFNGNSHTITYNGANEPLFEQMDRAAVSNLNIALRTTVTADVSKSANFGLLTRETTAAQSTITNVHVSGGTVTSQTAGTFIRIGGIIGEMGAQTDVKNCTVGEETSPLHFAVGGTGAIRVGGIAGYCQATTIEGIYYTSGKTFKNYVTMSLLTSDAYANGARFGGIVGGAFGRVRLEGECHIYLRMPDDSGSSSYVRYFGTIAGETSQSALNSFITMTNVTAHSNIAKAFGSIGNTPGSTENNPSSGYTHVGTETDIPAYPTASAAVLGLRALGPADAMLPAGAAPEPVTEAEERS